MDIYSYQIAVDAEYTVQIVWSSEPFMCYSLLPTGLSNKLYHRKKKVIYPIIRYSISGHIHSWKKRLHLTSAFSVSAHMHCRRCSHQARKLSHISILVTGRAYNQYHEYACKYTQSRTIQILLHIRTMTLNRTMTVKPVASKMLNQ